MDRTQTTVNGVVRLRLHKGTATVTGRGSADSSLYVPEMASYGSEDQFDHRAAEGFIYVWGCRLDSGQHLSAVQAERCRFCRKLRSLRPGKRTSLSGSELPGRAG